MLHPFRKQKQSTNNKSSNQESSRFFFKIENLRKGNSFQLLTFKISENKNLKLNFLFTHFNKVPRACPENHCKHLLFATTLNGAFKGFSLL